MQVRNLEAEARTRVQQHGADVLMGALAAMQDKNSHLEHSLSAETRIKLDLFSALGEANRKLELRDSELIIIIFHYQNLTFHLCMFES